MKFIKRFWWLIVMGFVVGGGIMLMVNSAAAKNLAANSYTVKKQDLVDTLSESGQIDAEEKADLKFQTSGMLAWVGVKEGDKVKKYQAVASLDKRELQNTFNQYMNDYLKERWDFEQAQSDNKDWQTAGMTDAARDTVKRTLQKDQFDLNNSVLDVQAKDLALKFATIYTPIAGIVTNVDVPHPGENITPSTATFTIVNPETLYFSASADQTEVTGLSVGQKCKVVLDPFPDQELDATVTKIGFSPISGESGTVYKLTIGVDFNGLDSKIKMGMTGDVDFTLEEKNNVLAVPEAYITKSGNKYYVTKLVGNLKQKTEVKTGDTINGLTIITSGLNEGDKVYHKP